MIAEKKTKLRLLLLLLMIILHCSKTETKAATFSKKAPSVTVTSMISGVKISWKHRSDLSGYEIYQLDSESNTYKCIKKTNKDSISLGGLTQGKDYVFRVRGYKKKSSGKKYTNYSKKQKVSLSKELHQSTLKKLLLTALKPVGSTMYIWGGGWNKSDTGAGLEARTMGVSPVWKEFFNKQNSGYDYNQTRYQCEKGLDCSGFVGWCIYNILNSESGNKGYVMLAGQMANSFASWGWGTCTSKSKVKNYRAGDIMSSSGHVWIVVGQCSDGSVVILHSSPPGVQLAGTPDRNGKTESEAVRLATYYMKTYFPAWYKKYPNCSKGISYLTQFAQMRWDLTGNAIMTDPDAYRKKTADEILKDLFVSR